MDVWNETRTELDVFCPKSPLDDGEIKVAFAEIMKKKDVFDHHCFCFFIDALDEHHDPPRDQVDLAKELEG